MLKLKNKGEKMKQEFLIIVILLGLVLMGCDNVLEVEKCPNIGITGDEYYFVWECETIGIAEATSLIGGDFKSIWYCVPPCTSANNYKVYYSHVLYPSAFNTLSTLEKGNQYWIYPTHDFRWVGS